MSGRSAHVRQPATTNTLNESNHDNNNNSNCAKANHNPVDHHHHHHHHRHHHHNHNHRLPLSDSQQNTDASQMPQTLQSNGPAVVTAPIASEGPNKPPEAHALTYNENMWRDATTPKSKSRSPRPAPTDVESPKIDSRQCMGLDANAMNTTAGYLFYPSSRYIDGIPRTDHKTLVPRLDGMSGIEKSGFRCTLDKTSEGLRKGIAKTFNFRRKNKESKEAREKTKPITTTTPTKLSKVKGARPQTSGAAVHNNHHRHHNAHDHSAPPTGVVRQQRSSHGTSADLASSAIDHDWNPTSSSRWGSVPLPINPHKAAIPSATHNVPTESHLIKRWLGAGRPVQRWNKLRRDPELWDPNGDVVVFFTNKNDSAKPPPSIRLSSHVIEAAESQYLKDLLYKSCTERETSSSLLPPSPTELDSFPPKMSSLADNKNFTTPNAATTTTTATTANGRPVHISMCYRNALKKGNPTPPASDDNSSGDFDDQISYEMYFPAPENLSAIQQLQYNLTTRNVFALLYNASLVGTTIYQTLTNLQGRLDNIIYAGNNNADTIVRYLHARGTLDVRNDPETAVGLLAWAESPKVRWDEGWKECFLHCSGMFNGLEKCADYRQTTPVTRALLERASLETQLRVHSAEDRLAEFQFPDMWPAPGAAGPGGTVGASVAATATGTAPSSTTTSGYGARIAANRLREFLVDYYTSVHGDWPPLPPSLSHDQSSFPTPQTPDLALAQGVWLTRRVARLLQSDFGALYDYLVNRDIAWDVSEFRPGRKWVMASQAGNQAFEADMAGVPVTDMLIEFDNKSRFPHIPYPYPLLPESIPPIQPQPQAKESTTTSLFRGAGRKNDRGNGGGRGSVEKWRSQDNGNGAALVGRARPHERRVRLAYTESTNVYMLGSDFTQCDFVEAFVKFEKTDMVDELDPAEARLGRWVLVYGILQVLASISVDAPEARYRNDVSYHLCPRLQGVRLPPWTVGSAASTGTGSVGGGSQISASTWDATHESSYCWVSPKKWNTNGGDGDGHGIEGGAGVDLSNLVPESLATGIEKVMIESGVLSAAMSMRSSMDGYQTPRTHSGQSSTTTAGGGWVAGHAGGGSEMIGSGCSNRGSPVWRNASRLGLQRQQMTNPRDRLQRSGSARRCHEPINTLLSNSVCEVESPTIREEEPTTPEERSHLMAASRATLRLSRQLDSPLPVPTAGLSSSPTVHLGRLDEDELTPTEEVMDEQKWVKAREVFLQEADLELSESEVESVLTEFGNFFDFDESQDVDGWR